MSCAVKSIQYKLVVRIAIYHWQPVLVPDRVEGEQVTKDGCRKCGSVMLVSSPVSDIFQFVLFAFVIHVRGIARASNTVYRHHEIERGCQMFLCMRGRLSELVLRHPLTFVL